MTIDLDELQQRIDAGTRTPWTWADHRYGPPTLNGAGGEPGGYEWEQEVLEATHDGGCGCRSGCVLELTVTDADRALIAAGITALPSLIAEARSSRARLAAVDDVLNRWATGPAMAQMVVAEIRAALFAAQQDR